MGVDVNYRTINYSNQAEFDYFFATAFDRYDRNRDGVIDYNEFQPLINDMCQMITQRYGYGPTVDKIRAAWSALDFNRSGYITRNEFSTRARYELERILTQPDYMPAGYRPGMYGAAPYGGYAAGYGAGYGAGYPPAAPPHFSGGYGYGPGYPPAAPPHFAGGYGYGGYGPVY